MDFHECVNDTDRGPGRADGVGGSGSACDSCTHKYEGMYSTHVYTAHVQEIITNWTTDSKPIFAYIAWQAVHEPLDVPASYVAPFPSIEDLSRQIYAGMLACLDEGIGNITATLKAAGLYEQSVLVLSNDNGGMSGTYGLGCCNCGTSCGGLNFPYRGWKDSFWEGGFRGNGFVHSPLLSKEGFTYQPLLHISDWYKTLLSAAMSQLSPDERRASVAMLSEILATGPIDSVDQWAALANGGSWKGLEGQPRSEILLAGIDIDKKGAAIRVGDLKLLVGSWGSDIWCDLNITGFSPVAPAAPAPPQPNGPVGGRGGLVCIHLNTSTRGGHDTDAPPKIPWWQSITGLYNVTADPRELIDLQHEHPEAVQALHSRLLKWNETTAPSIHKPADPAGAAHAKETNCWSPWTEPRSDDTRKL